MNEKFLANINSLKQYYNYAYEYLLLFEEINEEIINEYLNDWKRKRAENMAQLCFTMLHHAKNGNMMPSVIGDIRRFDKILMGFEPHIILETYCSCSKLRKSPSQVPQGCNIGEIIFAIRNSPFIENII